MRVKGWWRQEGRRGQGESMYGTEPWGRLPHSHQRQGADSTSSQVPVHQPLCSGEQTRRNEVPCTVTELQCHWDLQ